MFCSDASARAVAAVATATAAVATVRQRRCAALGPARSAPLALLATATTPPPASPLADRLTVGTERHRLRARAGGGEELDRCTGLAAAAATTAAVATAVGDRRCARRRSAALPHLGIAPPPAPTSPLALAGRTALATGDRLRELTRATFAAGPRTVGARAAESWTIFAPVEATTRTTSTTTTTAAAALPASALLAAAAATAPAADPGVVRICRRDRRCRDPHRATYVLDHRATGAATTAASRRGISTGRAR